MKISGSTIDISRRLMRLVVVGVAGVEAVGLTDFGMGRNRAGRLGFDGMLLAREQLGWKIVGLPEG
jgi:hypothetical protein